MGFQTRKETDCAAARAAVIRNKGVIATSTSAAGGECFLSNEAGLREIGE